MDNAEQHTAQLLQEITVLRQRLAELEATAIRHRQTQTVLPVSQELLATVLQGIPDGIVVQDTTGRLIYTNDVAARMLGYASAQALLAVLPQETGGQG
jgi:PAS domain-containing protein